MKVRFEGITVYKGVASKVEKAFDRHTQGGNKKDTVGAFYDSGETAIVLDKADFNAFCRQFNADPHGRDHKGYLNYHPAQYSHFASEVMDYFVAHQGGDATRQPVQHVRV